MQVGIIMGSTSDWPTMEHAARTLEDFGVSWEAEVVSAHRTPEKLYSYARDARGRGLKTIIAGAGGAAHLPGMTAAITDLPVGVGLGVSTGAQAAEVARYADGVIVGSALVRCLQGVGAAAGEAEVRSLVAELSAGVRAR